MADKHVFVCSEEEARLLMQVIEREKKAQQNQPVLPRPYDLVGPTASQNLVARIPRAGIPGITSDTTGTVGPLDRPGSVRCQIYESRFNYVINDIELVKIDGYTELVYNLNAYLMHSEYVPIIKDKFGTYMAAVPGLHKIWGKAIEDISYGSTFQRVRIWQNGDPTAHVVYVDFTWIGQSGDIILATTKVAAEWDPSQRDWEGAYVISNSNCDADGGSTGSV